MRSVTSMQVYLFICIKYRKWEKEYMRGSEVDVNSFEWKQVEMPEKWYEAKYIKISELG